MRAHELVKDALRGLIRAGGTTSAASAKTPDRLFKRHGHWASEDIKDGYVKDDFNSLLLLTQSLGYKLYVLFFFNTMPGRSGELYP